MLLLKGRRHMVQGLVFSRCGRWLAARGDGVHVWDTSNSTAKPFTPVGLHYASALAFRDDGLLFIQIFGGKWHLFDPVENELNTLKSPRVGGVVAAPDGRRAIRVNDSPPICVWEITPKGPKQELSFKRSGAIITAAFAPDGATFAVLEQTADKHHNLSVELTVRQASTGQPVCALPDAALSTSRVVFSPDSTRLFAFWTASLACWDLAKPTEAQRKGVNPGRRHFLSMAPHPNGQVLTVDNDRLVRVWNVPAMTNDRTITWNIGKLYAVAVSPDGTRAAVGGSNGKVLVWDWD